MEFRLQVARVKRGIRLKADLQRGPRYRYGLCPDQAASSIIRIIARPIVRRRAVVVPLGAGADRSYQLPCPVSLDHEPTPVSEGLEISEAIEPADADCSRIAAAAAVAAAAPKLTPFQAGAAIRTLWRRCSAAMRHLPHQGLLHGRSNKSAAPTACRRPRAGSTARNSALARAAGPASPATRSIEVSTPKPIDE